MARKKPTIKEMEKVVNSLIMETKSLLNRMVNIEFIFDRYVFYKKEDKKFKKYLEKKINESRRKTKAWVKPYMVNKW